MDDKKKRDIKKDEEMEKEDDDKGQKGGQSTGNQDLNEEDADAISDMEE